MRQDEQLEIERPGRSWNLVGGVAATAAIAGVAAALVVTAEEGSDSDEGRRVSEAVFQFKREVPRWQEDTLPSVLTDFADAEDADLAPIPDYNGHVGCWSAVTGYVIRVACPDGFIDRDMPSEEYDKWRRAPYTLQLTPPIE